MPSNTKTAADGTGMIFLEITLMSAQDLKAPPLHHLHSYATVSLSSPQSRTPLLRTRTDLVGVSNPTWNDKFIFRLPSPDLPSSALDIRILAAAPLFLPDPLLGSVRLLLGNHRLHSLRPSIAALGIRRPSGRFRGVLNVALTLLPSVSARTAWALDSCNNAVGFRDLMENTNGSPKILNLKEGQGNLEVGSVPAVVVETNDDDDEDKENVQPTMMLCGLRRSEQNIRRALSWDDKSSS